MSFDACKLPLLRTEMDEKAMAPTAQHCQDMEVAFVSLSLEAGRGKASI